MQITEIITDETLREIREHGTPEFPFEYYLDDIDEIGQGYVEWHWHNEIEWAWVESVQYPELLQTIHPIIC